jgi:magnesium transporter
MDLIQRDPLIILEKSTIEMNVKGAIRCITDLLENDEDMNNLLLTEQSIAKKNNEVLDIESHASVELLLEEYARQLNSILLEIDYLLQRVQSKQDILALSMDAYRNRMIRMNLYLSIGGVSLGFGTGMSYLLFTLLNYSC